MNLTDLKVYVQERKIVSLKEISMHFRADESALEGMLDRWVQKGQMRRVEMTKGQCGSCVTCADGIRIHYEWVGPQSIRIVPKQSLS